MNWFPERIIAAAFLAVPFVPVTPPIEFDAFIEMQRKLLGFETFGYWKFFSEPDADATIQAHVRSVSPLLMQLLTTRTARLVHQRTLAE